MKSHENWFWSNVLNTVALTFGVILEILLSGILNTIFFGNDFLNQPDI